MGAADRYAPLRADDAAPVQGLAVVTPSDTNNLPDGMTRGLYIGSGGDLVVDTLNSANVTLKNLNSGAIYPFAVVRVRSTGTTASSIVALY